MKPKSSQGNLADEVVDCQQEQRQWGVALRSHRPCLKMTGYLFVIAPPCDSVFSFNHALLTENKDSVNVTGLGFMVWGEALRHYRVRNKVLKDHFIRLLYEVKMKSEMELERQTTRRMDSLQMLSMCAMRSSLAAEASCSVFASPEVGVLGQCSCAPPMKYTFWRIMKWG